MRTITFCLTSAKSYFLVPEPIPSLSHILHRRSLPLKNSKYQSRAYVYISKLILNYLISKLIPSNDSIRSRCSRREDVHLRGRKLVGAWRQVNALRSQRSFARIYAHARAYRTNNPGLRKDTIDSETLASNTRQVIVKSARVHAKRLSTRRAPFHS